MELLNKRGNSIIEVIVVIVVLTAWLSGGYLILSRGNSLALTTEDRIQAVNIARDWAESVKNIRDTNWIKFSSDLKNCFDTKDYDVGCVGWVGTNRISTGSYSLSSSGGLPFLAPFAGSGTVYLDADGLVSQNGSYAESCTRLKTSACKTRFAREIRITRPNGNIAIESVVRWSDQSSSHELSVPLTLTNWKYLQTQ